MILLTLGLALLKSHAQEYRLIDLTGDVAAFSEARGISNSGYIAGRATIGDVVNGFLITDGWESIGTLGGAASRLESVNSKGMAAGFSQNHAGQDRGIIYHAGRTQQIPTFGGSVSRALAINESGQVAGHAETADGKFRAFVYADGELIDLESDGRTSYAYAINNRAEVAGNADFGGRLQPYLFRQGKYTDLGDLGGRGGLATSVNDHGQVAGYSLIGLRDEYRAFRWTEGEMADLGTLGGINSYAYAININGTVVGAAENVSGELRAVIARANAWIDLNTLVDESAQGWTLVLARSINDDGRIVGYGRNQGRIKAFQLTPVGNPPVQRTRKAGNDR